MGGSELDESNAIALCRSCHIREHEGPLDRERSAWRRLWRSRI